MFSKVKGTQDMLDCSLAVGVLKKIEDFLKLQNFSFVLTPVLEHVDLFQRGLGYGTDVVSKQMFEVVSKNEDEKICLRPEATAGIMRAYIEQKHKFAEPFNVFTFGPMFRYERPQKGRYRQFYQVNIESIGVLGVSYDALLIAQLYNLFANVLHLESFILKINYLGSLQDRKNYKEKLQAFLENNEAIICETCKERSKTNTLRCLDCKVDACQALYKDAPILTDSLSQESAQEFDTLQKLLTVLGVTFVHDPFLVRGLDYYNNSVFEFIGTSLGAQNAFCGGGRYDGLAQQIGSKEAIPSLGAAIGFERLLLLCEEKEAQLKEQKPALTAIIPVDASEHIVATVMTNHLSQNNICAQLLAGTTSLKSRLKKADKLGAKFVILIGTDEREQNYVTVKQMQIGKEEKVSQEDIVSFIKKS